MGVTLHFLVKVLGEEENTSGCHSLLSCQSSRRGGKYKWVGVTLHFLVIVLEV